MLQKCVVVMRTADLVGRGIRGARGVSPRPTSSVVRVCPVDSGVEGEAELALLAVGRVAQAGDGLVDAVVGLADPVDVARLLAGGDLAAELLGDADDLLDLLDGGDLLARLGPDGVL